MDWFLSKNQHNYSLDIDLNLALDPKSYQEVMEMFPRYTVYVVVKARRKSRMHLGLN